LNFSANDTRRCERKKTEETLGTVLVKRELLEYFTIFYNIAEGVASVVFGGVAGSIALIGFGIDSFVESFSGIVLLQRFRAEARGVEDHEAVETRAIRYVGWSFILLAVYIGFESIRKLWLREIPAPSIPGIIVPFSLSSCPGCSSKEADGHEAAEQSNGGRFQRNACVFASLRGTPRRVDVECLAGMVVGRSHQRTCHDSMAVE
jgi:hypothetical protein